MSLFCPVRGILTKKFQTLSSSSDCAVTFCWLRINHKWLWSRRCFLTETSLVCSETYASSQNYQTRGLTLLGVFRRMNREYFLTFLEGESHTLWVCMESTYFLPQKCPWLQTKFASIISKVHGNLCGSICPKIKISAGKSSCWNPNELSRSCSKAWSLGPRHQWALPVFA